MSSDGDFLPNSFLNPDKLCSFRKEVRGTACKNGRIPLKFYTIYGLLSSTDETKFHKYVTFNTFTKETFDIPSKKDGWLDDTECLKNDYKESESTMTWEQHSKQAWKRHKKWNRNHVCDLDTAIWKPPPKGETLQERFPEDEKYKFYRTLDNGGTGFIVIVGIDSIVHVYSRTKNVVSEDAEDAEDDYSIFFDNEVGVFHSLEIFIGKSDKNEMTDFSGGYGRHGNSILLRLKSELELYRYVYIGTNVFEFFTDEPVTKYISSVGNNSVPYPYAESDHWCYSMSECVKTSIFDHPNREEMGYIDYVDTATYTMFDIKKIHGRDSEKLKYPATNREEVESN